MLRNLWSWGTVFDTWLGLVCDSKDMIDNKLKGVRSRKKWRCGECTSHCSSEYVQIKTNGSNISKFFSAWRHAQELGTRSNTGSDDSYCWIELWGLWHGLFPHGILSVLIYIRRPKASPFSKLAVSPKEGVIHFFGLNKDKRQDDSHL